MYTLNQLKKEITEFFEGHSQINTVIYADDFDFAAYPDIVYPVVHIQPLDATIKGKEIINNFKIMIADIEDPNNTDSENEIFSDCELIADDFLTFYGDDDFESFLLDYDNINIQRFSESGTDRQAGIVFKVGVRQTRDINVCAVPLVKIIDGKFNDTFATEF